LKNDILRWFHFNTNSTSTLPPPLKALCRSEIVWKIKLLTRRKFAKRCDGTFSLIIKSGEVVGAINDLIHFDTNSIFSPFLFFQSGAKINISDGSCPERIVTVSGSTSAIYKAFTLITKKFEEVSWTGGLKELQRNRSDLFDPNSLCYFDDDCVATWWEKGEVCCYLDVDNNENWKKIGWFCSNNEILTL
jgi:hypothetical protein